MNYAGKERKFTNCSSFKAGKWVGSLLGVPGWGTGKCAGLGGEQEQRRDLGGSPLLVYF